MFRAVVSKSKYFSTKKLSSCQSGQIIIFNELSSQKTPKGSKSSQSAKPASSASPSGDVPGLSSNVLAVPSSEVGPGASKQGEYKNPEYFCYNQVSFFEAEVEMSKYRLPQPSAKAMAPSQ